MPVTRTRFMVCPSVVRSVLFGGHLCRESLAYDLHNMYIRVSFLLAFGKSSSWLNAKWNTEFWSLILLGRKSFELNKYVRSTSLAYGFVFVKGKRKQGMCFWNIYFGWKVMSLFLERISKIRSRKYSLPWSLFWNLPNLKVPSLRPHIKYSLAVMVGLETYAGMGMLLNDSVKNKRFLDMLTFTVLWNLTAWLESRSGLRLQSRSKSRFWLKP